MTNEILAAIIIKEKWPYGESVSPHYKDAAYDCTLAAIQEKEQQMIEYLYNNIQSLLKDYGISEASAKLATKLFLANLKQAMEE